jgi:hypothetical protein
VLGLGLDAGEHAGGERGLVAVFAKLGEAESKGNADDVKTPSRSQWIGLRAGGARLGCCVALVATIDTARGRVELR